MKKYIYIDKDNKSREVVYADTYEFPGSKLEDLFPDYFVKRCVEVDLEFDYKEGILYDWDKKEFVYMTEGEDNENEGF